MNQTGFTHDEVNNPKCNAPDVVIGIVVLLGLFAVFCVGVKSVVESAWKALSS